MPVSKRSPSTPLAQCVVQAASATATASVLPHPDINGSIAVMWFELEVKVRSSRF